MDPIISKCKKDYSSTMPTALPVSSSTAPRPWTERKLKAISISWSCWTAPLTIFRRFGAWRSYYILCNWKPRSACTWPTILLENTKYRKELSPSMIIGNINDVAYNPCQGYSLRDLIEGARIKTKEHRCRAGDLVLRSMPR